MMWNQPFNYLGNYNTYNPYQQNMMSQQYSYQNQNMNNLANNFQQPQQNNALRQNNIIWVTGKENARTMQLPPNSTVILLDSQNNQFYIKTTDDIGLGKLRVFNYTEQLDTSSTDQNTSTIVAQAKEVDMSNYITKDQLKKILQEIKENGNKNNEQQFVSVIK